MKENNSEKALTGYDWYDPNLFLPILAPDLYSIWQKEMDTDSDLPGFTEELLELSGYANYMVRYAISQNPSDSMAINIENGKELINPKTGLPFTIEDLHFDRNKAIGTTTSTFGREQAVAELTICLYRAIHSE